MSTPLRLFYRALLRLHPIGFRAEFGDEMLWIFDEESRHGRALHLLLDGLRSFMVQNLRPRSEQVEAAGPIYIELDSSLPSERFAQIMLTVLFCSLSLTLFTSMVVPGVAVPIGNLLYKHIRMLAVSPVPPITPPSRTHLSTGATR